MKTGYVFLGMAIAVFTTILAVLDLVGVTLEAKYPYACLGLISLYVMVVFFLSLFCGDCSERQKYDTLTTLLGNNPLPWVVSVIWLIPAVLCFVVNGFMIALCCVAAALGTEIIRKLHISTLAQKVR